MLSDFLCARKGLAQRHSSFLPPLRLPFGAVVARFDRRNGRGGVSRQADRRAA